MMKRLIYLCTISSVFFIYADVYAGSACKYGTDANYSYNTIGTHTGIIWSSGDINGTRCIEWTGDISTLKYDWNLSSGGSIGRVTRDVNSSGFNPTRVDNCGPMDVSRNVNFTDGGGGDWNNMIYGWLGSSPGDFAPATVEWYIIDHYDKKWSSGKTPIGTVYSNGSDYECYKQWIDLGFWQYVAFRKDKRHSGTVRVKTILNHFRNNGMANDYVIEIGVGCENFNGGSGAWEGSGIYIPSCTEGSGGGGGFPDTGKWYVLRNIDSGLNMRNENCDDANETKVELYNGTGNCAQWRFIDNNGNWTIRNRDSGLNLRHDGSSVVSNQTLAELWPDNGSKTYFKVIESSQSGHYHLQHTGSGLNLRNNDCADVNDQTRIEFYNGTGNCARWQFIEMSNVRLADGAREELARNEPSFSVYPNPVIGDHLYVTGVSETSIKIMNTAGKILIETSSNEIDVSNLTRGMYLLTADGHTRKVILK